MVSSEQHKWYIIQVLSGNEEKVMQVIQERAEQLGILENFQEIFIPYEEVIKVKHNKKVMTKRKLSPGYVFLYIHLNEDIMDFIKKIPKVSNFLVDDVGLPKVISSSEMDLMRKRMCQTLNDINDNVSNFEVGDEVIINDGLFQDFNGKVEYINEDKKIAGVSVMIFGRLTKIEFKLSHIQKLEG